MKKYLTHILLLILISGITSSCSSGSDGGIVDEGSETPRPEAVSLVFPLQNAECNQGVILSDTQSRVTFEWNTSKNTDKYSISLTNLNSNALESFSTTANETELDITLSRGVPYSWKVISKSNGTSQTAQSDDWNFFNAGLGIQNYAPFPAALISPQMGLTVTSSTITLEWNGSDADNDIKEFEIYFGTENPPSTLLNTSTGTQLGNVQLEANTVYYWQVVTIDQHDNSTESQVFEFKRE